MGAPNLSLWSSRIRDHGDFESFPAIPVFLASSRPLFEIRSGLLSQMPVRYPPPMAVSEELRRGAEESAQRLASMAPESSMRAAALLQEVKPSLASDRERRVAEEMARSFEERAARSGSALS
jgi:hypothetical protein